MDGRDPVLSVVIDLRGKNNHYTIYAIYLTFLTQEKEPINILKIFMVDDQILFLLMIQVPF